MFNAYSASAAETNSIDRAPAKAADNRSDNLLKIIIIPLIHTLPAATALRDRLRNAGL
jgi:hypothetical protein